MVSRTWDHGRSNRILKVSELIAELEQIMETEGDLECVGHDDRPITQVRAVGERANGAAGIWVCLRCARANSSDSKVCTKCGQARPPSKKGARAPVFGELERLIAANKQERESS